MAEKKTEIKLNAAHDPEIKGGTFNFTSEPVIVGSGEVTLDEMPAYYYRGARYTVSVTDNLNNIEVSEFVLMHDSVNVNLTNLSTVNNLVAGYIGRFTGRLVRGHLQLIFEGNASRHIIRWSKVPVKADAASPQSVYDQLADGSYSQEGNGGVGGMNPPLNGLIDDAAPALGGNLNVANHTIYGVNVTIDPASQLIITNDTVPSVTSTKNLGSNLKHWNSIYVDHIKLNTVALDYDTNSQRIKVTDNGDIYKLAKNLDDLADVAAPSPTVNQALSWNGTAWAARSVSSLAFNDINISGQGTISATSPADTLTLEAGAGILLTVDNLSKKITVINTVVAYNTTYTTSATLNGPAIDFNLIGSDAINDKITFSAGSGISITRGGPKEITIQAVQIADLSSILSRGNTAFNSMHLTESTSSTTPSTGTLTVSGGVGIGENLNVANNLTVSNDVLINGSLTVNGTTTTVNSTTVTVDDKNLELGSVTSPTDLTAAGGGITLKGATDKSIIWNNSAWTSSENFNVASGKAFQVNGASVLSATTLGSGVVNSSLTSVGTLTGLTSSGVVTVSNSTNSTAINNGALVVSGGVGIAGNTFIGGNLTVSGGLNFTGDVDLSTNKITFGPITEKIYDIVNANGTSTHNWAQQTLYYHSSMLGDFIPDVINVPTTNGRASSVVLVIEQSTTPHIPSMIYINSQPATIKWQGNAQPLGTSLGVDVLTFTIIRRNNDWLVLGQLVTFG
jgi:hypothetical protein